MNQNVGKAYSRNKEYFKKFDKSKIIKQKRIIIIEAS